MRSLSTRRPLVLGLLLAVAAAAEGAAIAGTAGFVLRHVSPGGLVQPITACIHNGNNQLRVVDDPTACGASSVALTWNAYIGGLVAVGDVFTTEGTVGSIDPDGTRTIARLPLPPGNYVLIANLEARDPGGPPPEVQVVLDLYCTIVVGNAIYATTRAADVLTPRDVTSAAGFGLILPLSLHGVASLTHPGKLELVCVNSSGHRETATSARLATVVDLGPSRLTAIAVGKVTTIR